MKELRLKALALGGAEVLTRAQMKSVFAGENGGGGGKVCGTAPNCNSNPCTMPQSDPTCPGASGTCGKVPAGCGCAAVC